MPFSKSRLRHTLPVFLFLIIVGGFSTWGILWQADRTLRADLLNQTPAIAKTINLDHVRSLTGTAADLDTIPYQELKESLASLRTEIPQCRFLYLLGRKANKQVVFLVDSEPANSKDYSPPGEVCEGETAHPSPSFTAKLTSVDGPFSDKWGTWISATVPLIDPDNGAVLAVLGMDIDAGVWKQALGAKAVLPVGTILLLLLAAAVIFTLTRRRFSPRISLASFGVLAVGLLITAIVTFHEKSKADNDAMRKFEWICQEVQMQIEVSFKAHAQTLIGAAALFADADGISRNEWRQFFARLNISHNLPGVQGLGYAELVPSAKLAEVTEAIRAEGFSNYQIRPAGEREVYVVVRYFEPESTDGNYPVGYDILTSSARREAMDRARDEDNPVLSRKVIFGSNPALPAANRIAALMFAPVYHNGLPLDTVEHRRAAIQGWVYTPYRMTDLIPAILKNQQARLKANGIDFHIHDGNQISKDTLLFNSNAAKNHTQANPAAITRLIPVDFGTQRWTLCFTQSPEAGNQADYTYTWMAGVIWTIISLLLFGLTISLMGTQDRAQRMANGLTAELRESEEQHRLLLKHLPVGVVVHAMDSSIIFANETASTLLGLSLEQMQGKVAMDPVWRFVHEDGRPLAIADYPVTRVIATGQPLEHLILGIDQPNHVRVWLLANAFPQFAADGKLRQVEVVFTDITARKEQEEQARQLIDEMAKSREVLLSVIEDEKESAEQLRKLSRIVEQAPISIVITDIKGVIEYVNPTFCATTGYTAAEAIGQNPRILKSGQTPLDVYIDMWQTLLRGDVWQGEFKNKTKSGNIYDEQAVIAPVTDETGKTTHYAALKQDITDEKAKETALRESEQRFRELFDQVSDAILVVEADTGRIIQANQVACATYGHTVAGLLAMCIADITAEAEQTLEGQEAAQRGLDQMINVPHRLHRKSDGTVFPVEINVRAFRRAGRMIMVEVIRDITEQVKAREQLLRFNVELEEKVTLRTEELALRNNEIEALLASIPDLVMRLRQDGTVLELQPAKGATPLATLIQQLNQQDTNKLLDPLVKAVLPIGHRALTEKDVVTAEAEITLGSASVMTELRIAPIGSAEVVVFARDITERKKLEAAMASTLEKQRQVSDMKSRFITVTSHEFRTPMAAAMASADLLHHHHDRLAPAKREELFTRINISLHRMTEMLDDVLLLNRIDADRLKVRLAPVELRNFAQVVIDEIRLADHDAHSFELHATGDATHFVTDADLLHHIISNLLSNAARYSPPGTAITTRLTAEDGRVLITVADHGIGVPAADRERIFESFERGSNVGTIKGTGLGLDIVKRMTTMLNGTVKLESPADGGSHFIVELPRVEMPATEPS